MAQPKWFNSDTDISIGDIVLFLKKDGEINGNYQYGRISSAPRGNDGKIRKVTVTYRNHHENVDRDTKRAVRELVMIHPINELSIVAELGKIATASDIKYKIQLENEQ